MKQKKKIVLLCGKGLSSRIVFNALNERYDRVIAIIESGESKTLFLKRRIKRLGLVVVVGQVLFQVLIVKTLEVLSKKRIQELLHTNNLVTSDIPEHSRYEVASVNAPDTLILLEQLAPDVIIVNGTRIISKKVIAGTGCKLINTHAGITPKYRGVHGAYWALVGKDDENCGVTVHFVDEGIDTGSVINQRIVKPTRDDNFVTYPFLQLAAGIELLMQAIDSYFEGTIKTKSGTKESYIWYHPTIWFYLWNRLRNKIK